MVCKNFCNYHCSYDCPNIRCDWIENYYDIPCSDAGYERTKCKDCIFNKNNSCDDCYLQNTENCER